MLHAFSINVVKVKKVTLPTTTQFLGQSRGRNSQEPHGIAKNPRSGSGRGAVLVTSGAGGSLTGPCCGSMYCMLFLCAVVNRLTVLRSTSTRALFSSKEFYKIFQHSSSHRIFRHIHEALNIDKK
jgi:hypothetical protein